MKKALAFLLTIVPGVGHVLLDRHRLGLFLFAVFAVSANGAFVGAQLWEKKEQSFVILLLSTLGLLLVYLNAFLSIWRLTFGLDEEQRARERAERLRTAVSHYLRGEMDPAEGILRALLRRDGQDVESLFYIAMIQRARGETPKARRSLRRCAVLDGRWKWDAERELRSLGAR